MGTAILLLCYVETFEAFRSLLLLQLTMSLRESGPEPSVHFRIRRSGRRRSRRRGRRGLLLVGFHLLFVTSEIFYAGRVPMTKTAVQCPP